MSRTATRLPFAEQSRQARELPYLQRYPFVDTSDPEACREAVAQAFRDVSVDPAVNRSFHHCANHLDRSGFAVGCSDGSDFRIEAGSLEDFYVLMLPIDGFGQSCYGHDTVDLAARRSGAVHSTQQPSRFRFGTRFRKLVIRLPRRRLGSHLAALVGRDTPTPPEFCPAVRANGLLSSLTRLTAFFAAELDQHDSLVNSDPIFQRVEELILTALLTLQPHSQAHLLNRPTAAPSVRQVREAESYMAAHCGDAIRMQDVARAAGVSLRSLQLAFRRHRGCSPGQFLRRLRLDHARRLLGSGVPGLTVTGVAHACGFLHLGQFGVDYRRRFNERPSDTLRRSR